MSSSALALVLVAALLHAGWNALTKRAADPLAFLWSSMGVAAVGLSPFAVAVALSEPFPREALPYVAGSMALHGVYFVALATSYRHGDFSTVYSVARGLGVALVPVLAFVLFAERLSPLGVLGIALVVTGIALGAARARSAPAEAPRPGAAPGQPSRALAWAVTTGLLIAAYSVVDAAGARRMHPVPFLCALSLGAVAACAPIVLRRREALVNEWRVNGRTILLASTMNLTGYVLVLWAYRSSKTGYVTACRELSIALSPFLGRVLLGETRLASRLAGAAIILGGVICVALAR